MKEVKLAWMREGKTPSVVDLADAPVHMNNEELALAHLLSDGWNIEAFNMAGGFFYFLLVRDHQE
jgi:hypothetical protein